jgi:GH43 family beta-xylosidase
MKRFFRANPPRRGVAPSKFLGLSLFAFAGALTSACVGNRPEAVAAAVAPPTPTASTPTRTFTNPVVNDAADPWVVYRGGNYYMTRTVGWGVAIRKSPTLAGLATAKETGVWKGGGPGFEGFHRDVWAPELHYLRGKWYAYFTATDGPDQNRRIFCIESKTNDPMGEYTWKGKVEPPGENFYAIDGTVWERPTDKKLFFLWSGRDPEATGSAQNIYIAPMSDPYTVSGKRVRLSTPEFDWERKGWLVNEGPEVLFKNGKTFVVYSASGGTTPDYALGLLSNPTSDLLNAANWKKSPVPVFSQYDGPDGHVYTPGHNGFFQSPDGREWWIMYHGKETKDGTWGGRHARAQKFTWRADDSPDFGKPIPAGIALAVPSGEKVPQNDPILPVDKQPKPKL